MSLSYIGRVRLKCSIECWRSNEQPLWVRSLAAADARIRLRGCDHCGERLEIADPIAHAAWERMEAQGRTGRAVGDAPSTSEG